MSLFWPLGATAAVGFGTVAFVQGFRALRVQRLIRDTPTAKVRSIAMGLVEVEGKVHARSQVVAPFTNRSCAWWEVELQTLSESNRGLQRWRTVYKEESGHPFYLEDATGLALVYPQGAEMRAGSMVHEETRGLGVPEPYAGFMAERHLGMRHVWSMGAMRFRERVVEEGSKVFVLGRAHPKPHAVDVSMDEELLQATGTEAIRTQHVRSYDGECCAVIRRGKDDAAFLISAYSEKTMSTEYGFKALGGLLGGPALTLFGVWCLIELAKSGDLRLPH